jgi:hypothetical protein
MGGATITGMLGTTEEPWVGLDGMEKIVEHGFVQHHITLSLFVGHHLLLKPLAFICQHAV